MRFAGTIVAAVVAAVVGRGFAAGTDTNGYIGVDIVERPEGLMVWRVLPGPLNGDFLQCASVARGDLIASIDGAPATLALWNAIAAREPGSKVRIGYREGSTRGWRGTPASNGAQHEVTVAVEDARLWHGQWKSGTLAPRAELPAKAGVDCAALPHALDALGPVARARGEKLIASLDGIPAQHGDPATPPLLRAMFAEPAKSEALVRAAIPEADAFRASPFRAAAKLVAALAGHADAALPEPQGTFRIEHPDAAIWYLDFLLNGARAKFAEKVAADDTKLAGLRPLVVERLDDLLVRGSNSREAMKALKAIPSFAAVDAAALLAHCDVTDQISPEVIKAEPIELPEALAGAVTGTIIAASEVPELGWLIVGGTGPNTYDLGRVAAVLDLGGDDRYAWKQSAAANRLVVDLAGDDVHTGGAELGPAGALGGIGLIDDRAGNDRYEGGALTGGCALGLSAIVDRAGEDVYIGGSWSLGAAAGGAAVIVDLAGSDRFDGEGMAIGVGGPSAVGAVIDLAGDDIAALGTRPSVYGVAGEHAGFGMGFGLGFRLAAAGGVGAYIDFEGRDQRRSGEFSQGCGYYVGVGILFDGAGDDLSSSDRYGIGSAAHQSAGIAIDLGGNDTYIGRTAAHVGAAWDESLGYFVDASGDDSYRVDGLSIGSSAQQALGIAIDRAGNDQYRGAGVVIGSASDNEYHFDAGGLGSLALFLDLAGIDLYPAARGNDRRITSPEEPGERLRDRDWVFIDEASGPAPVAAPVAAPIAAPAAKPS